MKPTDLLVALLAGTSALAAALSLTPSIRSRLGFVPITPCPQCNSLDWMAINGGQFWVCRPCGKWYGSPDADDGISTSVGVSPSSHAVSEGVGHGRPVIDIPYGSPRSVENNRAPVRRPSDEHPIPRG